MKSTAPERATIRSAGPSGNATHVVRVRAVSMGRCARHKSLQKLLGLAPIDVDGTCALGECEMPGPLRGSVSLFENGFRWYRAGWGRYTQSDPIGLQPRASGADHLIAYSRGNPLLFFDENGLDVRVCCRPLQSGALRTWDHCFIESNCNGMRKTWGLHNLNS